MSILNIVFPFKERQLWSDSLYTYNIPVYTSMVFSHEWLPFVSENFIALNVIMLIQFILYLYLFLK